MGSERVTRKSLRLKWTSNKWDDSASLPGTSLTVSVRHPNKVEHQHNWRLDDARTNRLLAFGWLPDAKTDLQAMADAEAAVEDWARSILAAFEKETFDGNP